MDQQPPNCACRTLGTSIQGAGHARRGEPCQDALECRPAQGTGWPALVAVADGHSSRLSFRSGTGARLAVQTAVEIMGPFLESFAGRPLSLVKRLAEERLPHEIVRTWSERVRDHCRQEPFSDAELQALGAWGGPEALRKAGANPLLVYGTTLLAAGVTESSITYLHLGDGDILAVGQAGDVFRPLAPDERAFADETSSLCLPEAWRDFRVGFQALDSGAPVLILLATDGYANCFATDEDFMKVGPDLLTAIRTHGPALMQDLLGKELAEASRKYSGDDITVGMIWFPDQAAGPITQREQPCQA